MRTTAIVAQSALLIASLVLSSCINVKLAYTFSDEALKLKIRSLFDLNSDQKKAMYASVDTFVEWHKQEEIDSVIDLIRDVQAATADGKITQSEFDLAFQKIDAGRHRYIDKAAPDIIALLSSLNDEQVEDYLETRIEDDEDYFDDLEDTEEERIEERVDDLIDSLEDWFDDITDEQVAFLHTAVDASDEAIERQKQKKERSRNYFYNLLKNERHNQDVLKDRLLEYLTNSDVHSPKEDQLGDNKLYTFKTNLDSFFALLSEKQLAFFNDKLDETAEDLIAITNR